MVIRSTGTEVKLACGNLQLCTRLEAGIEWAVNTMQTHTEMQQVELLGAQVEEKGKGSEGDGVIEENKEGDKGREVEGRQEKSNEVMSTQDLVLGSTQNNTENNMSTLVLGTVQVAQH
eukprot:2190183-Ditylum_brightwellii.AAC.1